MTALYIPAPPIWSRILRELRREYRTAKTIARQMIAAISPRTRFLIAAVIAGAIVGGLMT